MFTFDIVKKSQPLNSFRSAIIKRDFDVSEDHVNERFTGAIETPENWKIGVIFGRSGTGKSSIAKELFGDRCVSEYKWNEVPVIDDMPTYKSMEEIESIFYSVGFGSVPAWLRPYRVLSTGEKMRVRIARALLEAKKGDIIVFDEFTSVIDREVARTSCIAINKAINRMNDVKFIAVTCHYDVVDYLSPDWAFCTDNMLPFVSSRALISNSKSKSAAGNNGKSFADIII